MSHHHSFNTQARKRVRQKGALLRWKERLASLGQELQVSDNPLIRKSQEATLEYTKQQIAILESKGITV